jgi:hypothetical protein
LAFGLLAYFGLAMFPAFVIMVVVVLVHQIFRARKLNSMR